MSTALEARGTQTQEEFLAELMEEVQRNKVLGRHPLYHRLLEGELSLDEVRFFMKQYYVSGLGRFYTYIAGVLSKCTDMKAAGELAENVYEEATGKLSGTKAHPELFIDNCEAIGLSRDEVENELPIPEAQIKADWYEHISKQATFLEGLAAFTVGVEAQVPGASGAIGEALIRHYGATEESVKFWTMHDAMDAEHTGTGDSIIGKLAQTEEQRRLVRGGALGALRTQRLIWDGITDVIDRRRAGL